MDPCFLALSRKRRRKFDSCLKICTENLEKNPLDQGFWYLKCAALTEKNWIDDTEMEEEGVAELLLDDNAIAQIPRPGTSFSRPSTTSKGISDVNPSVRLLSQSGRPSSGFLRPGSRSSRTENLESAFHGSRPNTSRPVTSSGRFVRLGTSSMISEIGDSFVNVERLNLKKYSSRPALAKVLFEYLLHNQNNVMKALELASLATVETEDIKTGGGRIK